MFLWRTVGILWCHKLCAVFSWTPCIWNRCAPTSCSNLDKRLSSQLQFQRTTFFSKKHQLWLLIKSLVKKSTRLVTRCGLPAVRGVVSCPQVCRHAPDAGHGGGPLDFRSRGLPQCRSLVVCHVLVLPAVHCLDLNSRRQNLDAAFHEVAVFLRRRDHPVVTITIVTIQCWHYLIAGGRYEGRSKSFASRSRRDGRLSWSWCWLYTWMVYLSAGSHPSK